MENNEQAILSFTLGYMKYKSHIYGLSEKIKNARMNCLRFSEIVKSTINFDSIISNINISYYLKMPMPIMYRQFFRIISQYPEYVKSVCIDKKNPFHFACRRYVISQ